MFVSYIIWRLENMGDWILDKWYKKVLYILGIISFIYYILIIIIGFTFGFMGW